MKAPIHRMCTKKTYIREKIDCAPHFSAALILGGFSTARLQSAGAPRASCTFDRQVDYLQGRTG